MNTKHDPQCKYTMDNVKNHCELYNHCSIQLQTCSSIYLQTSVTSNIRTPLSGACILG